MTKFYSLENMYKYNRNRRSRKQYIKHRGMERKMQEEKGRRKTKQQKRKKKD